MTSPQKDDKPRLHLLAAALQGLISALVREVAARLFDDLSLW